MPFSHVIGYLYDAVFTFRLPICSITSALGEEPGWHPEITAFSNHSVSGKYAETNTSRGTGSAVFAGVFGERPDGESYLRTTRKPVPVGNTGAMWKLTPAD